MEWNTHPASDESITIRLAQAEEENKRLQSVVDQLQLEIDSVQLRLHTANSKLRGTCD